MTEIPDPPSPARLPTPDLSPTGGSHMTADAPVALDLLRRQVAALLSQIDTRALPQPDKVHRTTEDFPGREWSPSKGWRMFTVETPDGAGVVFIDHACDDVNYRWGEPGDWEALPIDQARRIGLALLAAAERADELFAGVSRLDAFRRAGEDDPAVQPGVTARSLKPTRANARLRPLSDFPPSRTSSLRRQP